MTTAKQTTETPLVRQTIERLFAAYNEHDVGKVMALFTDDVVGTQPGDGTVTGRPEAQKLVEAMKVTMPDLHFPMEDVQIFVSDDGKRAVATYRSIGTMTGPTVRPAYAPTGKAATIRGACLYEMRGDLIARHTIMYDMLDLMQQLGLMPVPDSLSARLLAGTQRVTHRLTHALKR